MKLSSRWSVMAVFALSALACSDPVPPASQGAFTTTVQSGVAGRICPSGASTSFDVPHVDPAKINMSTGQPETLTTGRYVYKTIDGEDGSSVHCSVKGGNGSFTFDGRIAKGPYAMELSSGTITGTSGMARVTLTDSGNPGFSHALSSPTATPCSITVTTTNSGVQVKAGSIWASFSCPSVVAEPSDGCTASGVFVLENCSQ